jgi:hypothetical protein
MSKPVLAGSLYFFVATKFFAVHLKTGGHRRAMPSLVIFKDRSWIRILQTVEHRGVGRVNRDNYAGDSA